MSRRIIVSSLAGATVLGAAGAYAFVARASESGPALRGATAVYEAPDAGRDGSLAFTARASDDSGVRSVKVLAWPDSMKPAPAVKEMAAVESAACAPAGDGAATCRYAVPVTGADAAGSPGGVWHIAVLVTAKDGDTAFVPRAAAFSTV
ncbi:hypothetical protein JS756_18570 [Streptomyces actuosus]|uniref:Uncharacterized protein n=1 Tax=Streptomyces actuosus TaxID=1885 RepID=A0ABS2VSQ8_STRAS|nr:DUF5707 domain-containing protein [Streptomyces actuosus]MBN0046070.1 hypothetical protein [Streptomyces actuosus]